jgi:hypothetical protein
MKRLQTIEYRGQRTTLLTVTTAMACPSYSLPAVYSCPGASKEPDSPCAHCYACQGFYLYDSTARAQHIRLDWTLDCLETPEGFDAWIDTMATEVLRTGCEYFRWHDSGDLFSVRYTLAVSEVCKRTENVKHWLATQSFNVHAIDVAIREYLAPLPNVVVRPSTHKLDAYPPVVRGYSGGATVYTSTDRAHESVRLCPKSTSGGSCASNHCRLCWIAPTVPVGYLVHGIGGKGRKTRVTDKIRDIRNRQRGETSHA